MQFPIGFHKSYTLTIRVKASVLKDLKLEKKKDWIDMDYQENTQFLIMSNPYSVMIDSG